MIPFFINISTDSNELKCLAGLFYYIVAAQQKRKIVPKTLFSI